MSSRAGDFIAESDLSYSQPQRSNGCSNRCSIRPLPPSRQTHPQEHPRTHRSIRHRTRRAHSSARERRRRRELLLLPTRLELRLIHDSLTGLRRCSSILGEVGEGRRRRGRASPPRRGGHQRSRRTSRGYRGWGIRGTLCTFHLLPPLTIAVDLCDSQSTYKITRPKSTRASATPIVDTEWAAWFDDHGKLMLTENEAKKRIFQRVSGLLRHFER